MDSPVVYIPNFVPNPDVAFASLLCELEWERRDQTPRSEYYCNDIPKPYVYGRGKGEREYLPRPYHPVISGIRLALEGHCDCKFEVCFLNRYHDQSDHLGWHSDDSPEMDDARPIGIVSLGVEREIWFKRKGEFRAGDDVVAAGAGAAYLRPDPSEAHRHFVRLYGKSDEIRISAEVLEFPKHVLTLGHGSLCIMPPGMQDLWWHRIPKASFKAGERVSLTFRGYVDATL